MRVESTTELIPIINVGMYGTELESIFDTEAHYSAISREIPIGTPEYDEHYSNAKEVWDGILVREARTVIEETLGLKITDAQLWKPTSYNYQDDRIDFTMEVPDDIIEIIETETKDSDFWGWVKTVSDYHSREGYISSFKTNPEDYYKELEKGVREKSFHFERCVAMYYRWKLRDLDFEEIQKRFEETMYFEWDGFRC